MNEHSVFVLGASGSFGGAMALELLHRGWVVRALAREPDKLCRILGESANLKVVSGDALDPQAVAQTAEGCSAIVHGINYPYHQWAPNMERVTRNVIAAASKEGTLILFPGNVYGFGAQVDRPLPEGAQMRPNSRKGELRVRLEEALRMATADGAVRVLVLRAGDYFGPTVRNGLVDRIFGAAARGKAIQYLGRLDIRHQWAYMPDLARVGADLLGMTERLTPFEVVHFKGYIANPQRDFLQLVARMAGAPQLPIRTIPWWVLRLMGLFDPVLRELMEMRYLFDSAIIIDDSRRQDLLPNFVNTPVEVAVKTTVESYRRSV